MSSLLQVQNELLLQKYALGFWEKYKLSQGKAFLSGESGGSPYINEGIGPHEEVGARTADEAEGIVAWLHVFPKVHLQKGFFDDAQ